MGNFLLGQSGGTPTLRDRPPTKAPARPEPTTVLAESSGTASKREKASAIADALAALAESASIDDLRRIESDVEALRNRVETLEERRPETVRFQIGENLPGAVLSGVRPEVGQIVRKYAAGLRNFYLCGPAGTGKSTLASTVAEAIGLRIGGQSFSPDVSSAALIGGPTISGGWNEPAFIDFFENGGVYLLDEIDAADSAIVLVINDALANGKLYLPRHPDHSRRVINRHKDCVVIAAANTWGSGPSGEYVGRSKLDAAFMSRFALARQFIGYDVDLERSICPNSTLLDLMHYIRKQIESNKIRRLCGTREVVAAAKLNAAGFTVDEIIRELTIDWTPEERSKCGA
jgi:MoxR-like ATPase